MLILIAESKTMSDAERLVTAGRREAHRPLCEDGAERVMSHLASLDVASLAAATGLTSSLVAKMRRMIYEFPNKTSGEEAIVSFTGVVFKALDYKTLTPEAKLRCESDVRIISSLYGLLRPEDIVKPYRLDFKAKAAPGDVTMAAFWKKDVTVQIVRAIQSGSHSEVLNLLPGDAAKCVDWKIVKRFCKVWKVDFVEVADEGHTRTPAASKLKTMRGLLLRFILENGLTDVSSLRSVATDTFLCEGSPVYPDHLQFMC